MRYLLYKFHIKYLIKTWTNTHILGSLHFNEYFLLSFTYTRVLQMYIYQGTYQGCILWKFTMLNVVKLQFVSVWIIESLTSFLLWKNNKRQHNQFATNKNPGNISLCSLAYLQWLHSPYLNEINRVYELCRYVERIYTSIWLSTYMSKSILVSCT